MTQLELQLEPKFTLSRLVGMNAKCEASFGYRPERIAIPRKSYDELVVSIPGGFLCGVEHSGRVYPVIDGVEIEVYDSPA